MMAISLCIALKYQKQQKVEGDAAFENWAETCSSLRLYHQSLYCQLIYLPIQKGFLPLKSHSHCMCCSLATLARLPWYLGSTREERVIRIPQ